MTDIGGASARRRRIQNGHRPGSALRKHESPEESSGEGSDRAGLRFIGLALAAVAAFVGISDFYGKTKSETIHDIAPITETQFISSSIATLTDAKRAMGFNFVAKQQGTVKATASPEAAKPTEGFNL